MNKKKHIQTDFIKFILEKYSEDPRPQTDLELDDELEDEIQDDDEIEDEKEPEDDDTTEKEDDLIDELLNEYKKLKKQYENRRVSVRGKRKSL